MSDEYLVRDEECVMILDGKRTGEERRSLMDRRYRNTYHRVGPLDRRRYTTRRKPGERRIGMVYAKADLFYEHLSAFVLGFFMILLGLCMIITGLTFMPLIGILAGIMTIFIGAGCVVRAFRAGWPDI